MSKGAIIASLLSLVIVVVWAIALHNQHDYPKETLENFGGEEKLLRKLEDPTGKTPRQAAAERQLANAFREDDARKK